MKTEQFGDQQRRRSLGLLLGFLGVLSVTFLSGCGQQTPQGNRYPPGSLKRKLADMNPKDRAEYMKTHPEVIQQLMRGPGGGHQGGPGGPPGAANLPQ